MRRKNGSSMAGKLRQSLTQAATAQTLTAEAIQQQQMTRPAREMLVIGGVTPDAVCGTETILSQVSTDGDVVSKIDHWKGREIY